MTVGDFKYMAVSDLYSHLTQCGARYHESCQNGQTEKWIV